MNEELPGLIRLRIQQSQESIQEASTLYNASLWRGVINRAYYSMFYAVLALAAYRQEGTSKHSGVVAFFDREFVKTGIFAKEYSKSFHLAFQRRQENDYGNLEISSQEDAELAMRDAEAFVEKIRTYLYSVLFH